MFTFIILLQVLISGQHHLADSLSYDIVDRMQLFTRDNLLKDLSPPATDTRIATRL